MKEKREIWYMIVRNVDTRSMKRTDVLLETEDALFARRLFAKTGKDKKVKEKLSTKKLEGSSETDTDSDDGGRCHKVAVMRVNSRVTLMKVVVNGNEIWQPGMGTEKNLTLKIWDKHEVQEKVVGCSRIIWFTCKVSNLAARLVCQRSNH